VYLAKRRALLVSCVFMSMAVPAGFTPYRYFALVCLVLTGAGVAGFLVLYLTFVQDLDPAHVGVTSGLLGGLGNLAYGVCSPYIGRLSDIHETSLIFMFIGLLPWLAFFAILWGIREMKP